MMIETCVIQVENRGDAVFCVNRFSGRGEPLKIPLFFLKQCKRMILLNKVHQKKKEGSCPSL
jgi:hypothetical protein